MHELPKQERTDYRQVREEIRDGDVALFRNAGIVGRISGDWTHAAVCKWLRDEEGNPSTLMLAESREWHGGRMVTLSSQITKFPGRIDIFRPACGGDLSFVAAELACRQAGHPYGYWSILLAGLQRLDLLRLCGLLRFNYSDVRLSSWSTPKHCSQLVCWCYRKASRQMRRTFDLVPERGDRFVEPTHLANSGSIRRLFTGLTYKGAVV